MDPWRNEFNLFHKLKNFKKWKRYCFLKLNSLFSSFWNTCKERLFDFFSKMVKFLNSVLKFLKKSSYLFFIINWVQFIGSGCKVLLLSLEHCLDLCNSQNINGEGKFVLRNLFCLFIYYYFIFFYDGLIRWLQISQ